MRGEERRRRGEEKKEKRRRVLVVFEDRIRWRTCEREASFIKDEDDSKQRYRGGRKVRTES